MASLHFQILHTSSSHFQEDNEPSINDPINVSVNQCLG